VVYLGIVAVGPTIGSGNGAGPGDASLELERRRALDRERNKRFRASRRAASAHPEPQIFRAPAGPDGRAAGAPVHGTRPLSELGDSPAEFSRPPPPIDHIAAAEPVDPEGAKKFAAIVALVFRLALDDAARRYDLARAAAELGADLGDDVDSVKRAAVGFVFERAERVAIKYGFAITIPYEDEIVTLAAGGGSLVYLLMKVTGRLDRRSGTSPPVSGESPPAPVQPFHPDGVDADDFAAIRVERIDGLQ
jgi:hypothetical protein